MSEASLFFLLSHSEILHFLKSCSLGVHTESEQSFLYFYLSFAITEEDSDTQRIFDPKYVDDYEVFLNKQINKNFV